MADGVAGVLEMVEKLNDQEKGEVVCGVVEKLTVLGLAKLVKDLEAKFGVSAAAPAAVAAAGPAAAGGGAAAAEAKEEKTSFDVVLKEIGANKIQVIKVVRAYTNLGLKEAKELVEKAPTTVKEALPKEEAEKLKKELADSGATVELK